MRDADMPDDLLANLLTGAHRLDDLDAGALAFGIMFGADEHVRECSRTSRNRNHQLPSGALLCPPGSQGLKLNKKTPDKPTKPTNSGEDTFSLDGDVVGFDLTGILDSESEKERMAVLSYLFRRVERVIEDRQPTTIIIIIDEAWKALDNGYFAERLSNWLVTARKQNAVVVMMTQYASQLEQTRTGKTIIEAVPTQILLPNIRANASDYAMLNLHNKELDVLLNTGSNSRLGLVRDDEGSVVINADLSALGPLLTILGGMEKGEQLVGADYRQRPDFWRVK